MARISLVVVVALYAVLATTLSTSTSALRPLKTNLNVLPGTKVDELSKPKNKFLNTALNIVFATTRLAHHHQHQAVNSDEELIDNDDDSVFADARRHGANFDQKVIAKFTFKDSKSVIATDRATKNDSYMAHLSNTVVNGKVAKSGF